MAGMFSFAAFNKERLFDVDTSDFEYTSLEELYEENGPMTIYPVRGLYIGTKSETPLVATDTIYVNLPQHQLLKVKEMIDNKAAVKAINNGECAFRIEKFYQKRFDKDCYVAIWDNVSNLQAWAAENKA